MAIPTLIAIVQVVRDSRQWDFSSDEGVCAFSHAVVVALHTANADFGHLRKRADQNHCVDPLGRNVAVDVTLYRPTGQVVDFIRNVGPGTENAVAWTVGPVNEYTVADWLAPVDREVLDERPAPGDREVSHERLAPVDREVSDERLALHTRVTVLETRTNLVWEIYAELAKQIGIQNRQLADLTGQLAELTARPVVDHRHRVAWWMTSGPT